MRIAPAICLLACAAATVAQAQESGAEEAEKKNFVELFVGITHDDGDNEASLGLTYERKFGRFGTGLVAEFTKAEELIERGYRAMQHEIPLIQSVIEVLSQLPSGEQQK